MSTQSLPRQFEDLIRLIAKIDLEKEDLERKIMPTQAKIVTLKKEKEALREEIKARARELYESSGTSSWKMDEGKIKYEVKPTLIIRDEAAVVEYLKDEGMEDMLNVKVSMERGRSWLERRRSRGYEIPGVDMEDREHLSITVNREVAFDPETE